MNYFLLILFILMPFICNAEVYKSVDANGNVTFTDKPTINTVPVELPKTNSTPATQSPNPTTPPSNVPQIDNSPSVDMVDNQTARKPYTTFIVSSPVDQETIQNQPTIPVKIDIQPALQAGDLIQIYLDGAPWGNALPSTSFDLTAPDRGTHVISATLFDNSMRVLKQSNSNTIFIHHAHI